MTLSQTSLAQSFYTRRTLLTIYIKTSKQTYNTKYTIKTSTLCNAEGFQS